MLSDDRYHKRGTNLVEVAGQVVRRRESRVADARPISLYLDDPLNGKVLRVRMSAAEADSIGRQLRLASQLERDGVRGMEYVAVAG